jgi:hypothetical protein
VHIFATRLQQFIKTYKQENKLVIFNSGQQHKHDEMSSSSPTLGYITIRDIPKHFFIPYNFLTDDVLQRASGGSNDDTFCEEGGIRKIRLHEKDMEMLQFLQYELQDQPLDMVTVNMTTTGFH